MYANPSYNIYLNKKFFLKIFLKSRNFDYIQFFFIPLDEKNINKLILDFMLNKTGVIQSNSG